MALLTQYCHLGVLCALGTVTCEGPPQSEMSPDQPPELRGGMHKAFPGQECPALLCLGVHSTLFIQRVSLTEPSRKSYLQLKQKYFGFVRASLQ